MSSREFEDVLIDRFGCDRDAAETAWTEVLAAAGRALLNGRAVSLIHVATLKPYEKKETAYRDPATGKLREIPPRWHVKLTLSPDIKAKFHSPTKAIERALVKAAERDAEREARREARRAETAAAAG